MSNEETIKSLNNTILDINTRALNNWGMGILSLVNADKDQLINSLCGHNQIDCQQSAEIIKDLQDRFDTLQAIYEDYKKTTKEKVEGLNNALDYFTNCLDQERNACDKLEEQNLKNAERVNNLTSELSMALNTIEQLRVSNANLRQSNGDSKRDTNSQKQCIKRLEEEISRLKLENISLKQEHENAENSVLSCDDLSNYMDYVKDLTNDVRDLEQENREMKASIVYLKASIQRGVK